MYDFFPFHVLPPSSVSGFTDQPSRLFRYSPAFLTYREYHIVKPYANSYNEYRDILNPHIRKRTTVLPTLRSFSRSRKGKHERHRARTAHGVVSSWRISFPPKSRINKQASQPDMNERLAKLQCNWPAWIVRLCNLNCYHSHFCGASVCFTLRYASQVVSYCNWQLQGISSLS